MGSDKSKERKKHHKRRKDKCQSEYKSADKKYDQKKHKRDKNKGDGDNNEEDFNIPVPKDLQSTSKSMAPMTKEEWDKRQSVIRKVYDETTGRHRIIKGDGEILEEIVGLARYKEINKQATRGDGEYFQHNTVRSTK